MKKRSAPKGPFLCYAIKHNHSNRVYTGQTNCWKRRIRQHNGELKGGARYTKSVNGGWSSLFHVCGFTEIRHVLQFEIAMKKRHVPRSFLRPGGGKKRKRARTRGPVGRIRQLEYILSLGKLNAERTHAGLRVTCHMRRTQYLKMSGMTAREFTQRRATQGVPFTFVCADLPP